MNVIKSKMEGIKRLRNKYVNSYDKVKIDKDFHEGIIDYYGRRYRMIIKEPRPLTPVLAYEKEFLQREFDEYKRKYGPVYEWLKYMEEQLTIKIIELNAQLGYEEYDLESDEN